MMEDLSEMGSDSLSDDYIKQNSPKMKTNQSAFDSPECSQSVGYTVFPCPHCACFFKSAESLESHIGLEHEKLNSESTTGGEVKKTEKQISLLHYLREKINIMENAETSEDSEITEAPVSDNLDAANYMYSLQSVAGIEQLYCLMCSFVCDSLEVMQAHFAQKHEKSGLLELLIASTLGNRGNSKYGAYNNKECFPNEKENPRILHIRKENKSPEYNTKEVFFCPSCSMKFSSMILLDIHNAQQHKNKDSSSLKSLSSVSTNKNSFPFSSASFLASTSKPATDNEMMNRQSKIKGKINKEKALPSNNRKNLDNSSQSKLNSFVSSRLEEVQTRMTKTLILKDSSEEMGYFSFEAKRPDSSENSEDVPVRNSSSDYTFKTRDKNRSTDPNDDCSQDDDKRLHCQQCNFSTISLKRLQHHNYQKHDQCDQDLNVEPQKAKKSLITNDKISLSCSASTSSHNDSELSHSVTKDEIDESSSSDLDEDGEEEEEEDDEEFVAGSENESITCKKCFKLIKRCDLKQHNQEVHDIGEGNFECKHCFKRFKLKKHLTTHLKIHDKSPRNHKCKYCAKICASAAALSLHLKGKHADNKPFICKYCGKGFAKSCEQQLHHQSHTGEKSYKCDVCGRSFLTKVIRNQHMKTHTTEVGKDKHICSACSKSFPSASLLESHACSHSGGRRFQCEFCEKTFKSKKQAENHRWVHTREKLFKCEHCPKTFHTSGQATVHRRSHTSDKPFTCDICCKAFASSAQFIAHQKTHS